MHGGVAQGIGQAFSEHIVFDPRTGQLVTGTFLDYGMPRADDMCSFDVEENPVKDSPSRGIRLEMASASICKTLRAVS